MSVETPSQRYERLHHDRVVESRRKFRETHREERAAANCKYREENPDKFREYRENRDKKKTTAQNAVIAAIRSGKLVRPDLCESSRSTHWGQIEAHHEDYDKPLEVDWLCKSCHRLLHEEERH